MMRSDHDERFQRIISDYLERPAGDYGELLTRGQVSSPEATDPELCRAEIRVKARKDKIRVATFRNGDRSIAMRRRHYSDEETRAELERGWELEQLGWRARDLGHELVAWIRSGQPERDILPPLRRPHLRPYRRRAPGQRRRSSDAAVPGRLYQLT